MKRFLLFLFVALVTQTFSQVRLPAVFCDHMVLQRESDPDIWGWAIASEELTITTSWDNNEIKVITDNSGRWKTQLNTGKAGGPFEIKIKGSSEIVIRDVMIGEVWICSGQSNMEWSVLNGSVDAKAEMPNANNQNIRLFYVFKSGADSPQERGEGIWEVCSPKAMERFSAVGYFFGKKLQEKLDIPIGLVNVNWGGTPAEVWATKEAVEKDNALSESAKKLQYRKWWPQAPGSLYNGMIHPLVPYEIAGTIWYQGETNVANVDTYSRLMKAMVSSWRSAFEKEFPFYFVQIAPYSGYGNNGGAYLREQQVLANKAIKNCGMVIISDHVDDIKNIHPTYKKPVGDRLADYALVQTYGMKGFPINYPTYVSMAVEKNKIRVTMDQQLKGKSSMSFEIAGEDKVYHPAVARINGNQVVVSSKEVKEPVAVRYAWSDSAIGDLYSAEGLPASCFRSDN